MLSVFLCTEPLHKAIKAVLRAWDLSQTDALVAKLDTMKVQRAGAVASAAQASPLNRES